MIYRMCVITYSRGRCQDHWFNLKAAGYDECVAKARRRYPGCQISCWWPVWP